jgi:hypothetical protein
MLRIFIYRKIQRLKPGLNPRTREPEASMRTTRPPKPSSSRRSSWSFTTKAAASPKCFVTLQYHISKNPFANVKRVRSLYSCWQNATNWHLTNYAEKIFQQNLRYRKCNISPVRKSVAFMNSISVRSEKQMNPTHEIFWKYLRYFVLESCDTHHRVTATPYMAKTQAKEVILPTFDR